MIIKKIVVSAFQENCFIIASENTKNGFLIDPGDEADKILKVISDNGITIKKIINTHAHLDHVGAVKEIKEKLDVPFYLHKEDEELLNALPQQAALFGLNTQGVPSIDGFLNEGDIIELDDISFEVLYTPGHTQGGVSFLEKDFVIAGDTLFAGSIGRTDLPGGSYPQLIESINNKLMHLDDNIVVYSGHGHETTIGFERQNNPFLNNLE